MPLFKIDRRDICEKMTLSFCSHSMNLRNGLENLVVSLQGEQPAAAQGSIVLEGVSKKFRKHTLSKKSYSTVKTSLLSRLFSRRYPPANFVQALDNITLRVEPGKSVGVIGRNGSGKSTLLKLVSSIYRPDTGKVETNGKISALIELGAGFHPDFTGRENVYLGGVMYGLTRKEVDARFDDIVRYAELEDFIDDPVRTYSSGMYMRLGFSLAVHTDPDILLIDEVLAVGDAGFIHRCHETISEFRRKGKTMLFVTHDLDSVARWCDEAIWLEKGVIRKRGEPRWVIDQYLDRVNASEERVLEEVNAAPETADESAPAAERWGNRDVEITAVRMIDRSGEAKWLYHGDDPVTIEVDYQINKTAEDLVFGVGILRADGVVVHGTNTDIENVEVPLPAADVALPARGTYSFAIKRLGLLEDSYFVDVAAHRKDGKAYDYHHLRYRFSVRSQVKHQGVYAPEHDWNFAAGYEVLEPFDKLRVNRSMGA